MTQERELTTPVDLCLPNGRLNPNAVGWLDGPRIMWQSGEHLAR